MQELTNDFVINLPEAKDEYPFVAGERETLIWEEPLLPAVWTEENFILVPGAGYACTGKLSWQPWQVAPVNAISTYDRVILCGPVQTGKSLIAEAMVWYCIYYYQIHGMFCYAKRDTVENVFQDRIKPTIEQVPVLRMLWDGNPDNLTKDKIKLRNSIIRVASAQVPSDLATFSAGLIYASEVCKYRHAQSDTKSKLDTIKALRGRQEAYGIIGRKKEVLESSPLEEGDPLHCEMFKSGVINLRPHFPCPRCGKYQELLLEQIKEVPSIDSKGEKVYDHDPDRIRQQEAAFYECKYCGNSIQERDRIEMGQKVVWAMRGEAISQEGHTAQRRDYNSISFQWNRFVDYSFKFSEGLARFFEAQRSGDPVKLRTFFNEDMGEFANLKSAKEETSWVFTKCCEYNILDEKIPEWVSFVLLGIDTQDFGFYFVLRGFGFGKKSLLLDYGFIKCEMGPDQSPGYVLETVLARITKRTLVTKDGRQLEILAGLIDRGGHKQSFVDHLVNNIPNLYAYTGSTSKGAPLIRKGNNGLYLGNTENLSRIVSSDSVLDNWFLPENINSDYARQFVKQYDRDERDKDGNTKRVWVHGGEDHLRDCENYIQGAYVLTGLHEVLFDELQHKECVDSQKETEEEQDQSNTQYGSEFFGDLQERWSRRAR